MRQASWMLGEGPRTPSLLIAACLLFLLVPGLLEAQAQASVRLASPARLQSGPDPVRGLPFFPPNAIFALRGEYFLGEARAKVYSTREPLVFGTEWRRLSPEPVPGLRAMLGPGPSGPILAMLSDKYCLFVEVPQDSPAFRRFAFALESRFSSFFEKAPSDAELSFPAYVDFRP